MNCFLVVVVEVLIPILEEDDFCDEVFPGGGLGECLEHGVEDGLGVSLVHLIEEGGRFKVDVFEFGVSVEPEGVEVGVEGDEKLPRVAGTELLG